MEACRLSLNGYGKQLPHWRRCILTIFVFIFDLICIHSTPSLLIKEWRYEWHRKRVHAIATSALEVVQKRRAYLFQLGLSLADIEDKLRAEQTADDTNLDSLAAHPWIPPPVLIRLYILIQRSMSLAELKFNSTFTEPYRSPELVACTLIHSGALAAVCATLNASKCPALLVSAVQTASRMVHHFASALRLLMPNQASDRVGNLSRALVVIYSAMLERLFPLENYEKNSKIGCKDKHTGMSDSNRKVPPLTTYSYLIVLQQVLLSVDKMCPSSQRLFVWSIYPPVEFTSKPMSIGSAHSTIEEDFHKGIESHSAGQCSVTDEDSPGHGTARSPSEAFVEMNEKFSTVLQPRHVHKYTRNASSEGVDKKNVSKENIVGSSRCDFDTPCPKAFSHLRRWEHMSEALWAALPAAAMESTNALASAHAHISRQEREIVNSVSRKISNNPTNLPELKFCVEEPCISLAASHSRYMVSIMSLRAAVNIFFNVHTNWCMNLPDVKAESNVRKCTIESSTTFHENNGLYYLLRLGQDSEPEADHVLLFPPIVEYASFHSGSGSDRWDPRRFVTRLQKLYALWAGQFLSSRDVVSIRSLEMEYAASEYYPGGFLVDSGVCNLIDPNSDRCNFSS